MKEDGEDPGAPIQSFLENAGTSETNSQKGDSSVGGFNSTCLIVCISITLFLIIINKQI